MYKYFILILLFASLAFSARAKSNTSSFSATFIDNLNVTTIVNNVEYKFQYPDSPASKYKHIIYGRRGKSIVTVPWEKIKRIDFVEDKKNYNAVILLKDNRIILIYADLANAEYFGFNDFGGSFQINAEYVRSIIFN